ATADPRPAPSKRPSVSDLAPRRRTKPPRRGGRSGFASASVLRQVGRSSSSAGGRGGGRGGRRRWANGDPSEVLGLGGGREGPVAAPGEGGERQRPRAGGVSDRRSASGAIETAVGLRSG